MTLEIPAELGQELERIARMRGTDVTEFVIEAARQAIESEPRQIEIEARRRAVAAGLGMFAGRGASVDEFLAERHAEGEAKYEKWMESQTAMNRVDRDQK